MEKFDNMLEKSGLVAPVKVVRPSKETIKKAKDLVKNLDTLLVNVFSNASKKVENQVKAKARRPAKKATKDAAAKPKAKRTKAPAKKRPAKKARATPPE